jgi:hypothetical protein
MVLATPAAAPTPAIINGKAADMIRLLLDYQTLWAHRQRLDCARLILTHMSQDMLSHLGEVEVECAEDGKVVVL